MYSKPFPPALEPSPALIKMLEIMKELYTIDMEATQKSKRLDELPLIDIVVSMGLQCELSLSSLQESGGLGPG